MRRPGSRLGGNHPLRDSVIVAGADAEILKAAANAYRDNCPQCECVIGSENVDIYEDETGTHAAMTCPHCNHKASKLLAHPKAAVAANASGKAVES